MSIVLAMELSDQAAKADQHGVNDTFVNRPNLKAKKKWSLMDACEILHVAGEAIECFDDTTSKGFSLHHRIASAGHRVPSAIRRSGPDHHSCGRRLTIRGQRNL